MLSTKNLPKYTGWLCAIIGCLVTAGINIYAIQLSTNSTAAIGYVFLPLNCLMVAVPAGIFGYCLGYLIKGLLTKKFTWQIGLVLLIVIPSIIWTGKSLVDLHEAKSIIRSIPSMNQEQLDNLVVQQNNPKNSYQIFILGMILQNENTSSDTLNKIANMKDKQLYERMGSVFDIQGNNTRGLSVMHLLVRHPNVTPDLLTQLVSNTEDEYVLSDIAKNPKTPEKILRQLFQKNDKSINLSLAWNPKLPLDLLLDLANSQDTYVLIGITRNPKTPKNILEKLATSQDESVRTQAKYSLAPSSRQYLK